MFSYPYEHEVATHSECDGLKAKRKQQQRYYEHVIMVNNSYSDVPLRHSHVYIHFEFKHTKNNVQTKQVKMLLTVSNQCFQSIQHRR